MAGMKKAEVVEALMKIEGLTFDKNGNYNKLAKLLKQNTPDNEKEGPDTCVKPKQIRLENRIPKKNMFLVDSFRNERDARVLNGEIGKREHKGKIKCITTVKEMEVTKSGDWLTTFIIDLKG